MSRIGGSRQSSTNKLKGAVSGGVGSIDGLDEAQNRVARQLMADFTQAGMTRAGAAGMIGNWVQESSLNPAEPGGYMAQWGGARLQSLVSYAANMGKPVTDVDAQAAFAVHELRSGYSSLWTLLTTTHDPKLAATAICNQYERPLASAANLPHRVSAAQQAYGSLSGSAGTAAPGGGLSGGGSVIGIATDLLTGNFSDLGARLAMVGVTLVKDLAFGIADFVIIPFWHWNQRAIMFYYQEELMPTSNATWTVLPWTAAFWGFGYYLLFTDPDAPNLKPAPVRNTRLARHVRSVQALPARRSLIKPGDVSNKTPKKPTPVVSRATVTQTGTMRVTRNIPVRVTGENARERQTTGTAQVKRTGEIGSTPEPRTDTPAAEPHAHNRAGHRPLSDRRGDAQRGQGPRGGRRYSP